MRCGGLCGAVRGPSVVYGERELRQQRALVRLAHGADVHRHRGPDGCHQGCGRRLVVRHGSDVSDIGGCHRSSGGRDRGGARSALGGEVCGPRARERGEEPAALLLAPEARPLAQLVGDRDEDDVDGQVGVLAVDTVQDAPLGRNRVGLGEYDEVRSALTRA